MIEAKVTEVVEVESPMLDVDEVIAYMKVSESTLARMRRDKNGPPYAKIGTKVLYRKADLDAFIESKLV